VKFKTIISKIKNKFIKIKNNKTIIFIMLGILFLLILIGIIISKFSVSRKEINIELSEVLNIFDIESEESLKIKESKKTISDKYKLDSYSLNETKETIKLGELQGKMLFLRSNDMNANIYQVNSEIIEYSDEEYIENGDLIPPLIQINDLMNTFKNEALIVIGMSMDIEPVSEKLYGESKYNFSLPTEESIYVEKRLYSLRYEIDEYFHEEEINDNEENKSIYELNFYMNGKYFICEMVKILDLS